MSRLIKLREPVRLPIRILREIMLREPGRRVAAAMAACRPRSGFTDAQAIRFASRLSGLSEATLRRMTISDLAKVKAELEALYRDGGLRETARKQTGE